MEEEEEEEDEDEEESLYVIRTFGVTLQCISLLHSAMFALIFTL
jgi:hypothetical protein